MLPDVSLLKIFDFYLYGNSEAWHALVYVGCGKRGSISDPWVRSAAAFAQEQCVDCGMTRTQDSKRSGSEAKQSQKEWYWVMESGIGMSHFMIKVGAIVLQCLIKPLSPRSLQPAIYC